jgi:hypothetical protein
VWTDGDFRSTRDKNFLNGLHETKTGLNRTTKGFYLTRVGDPSITSRYENC